MDIFIFITEILGTAAFAITGAVTGIRKNMDIFGVVVLGLTTAVGGGVIRDVILGRTPPVTFLNPVYAIVATIVSILLFIPTVNSTIVENRIYDLLLFVMDTVGLGIFTVVGVWTSYEIHEDAGMFLAVFVGVVTGVGGGVLRDMFAQDMPYIFKKHVYAVASLVGAVLCCLLRNYCGEALTCLTSMAAVATIRVLASHYNWNLPHSKDLSPDKEKETDISFKKKEISETANHEIIREK